jgi:hypothetical protein
MARSHDLRKSQRNRQIFGAYCSLFALFFTHAALAETVADLENKLNGSNICTPLKFDAKKVAEYLGYKVSALIRGNTTVGWDKNSHKVKSFSVDANHNLRADIELGCQPSSQGAILKLIGKKPAEFRITDNVDCTGTVGPDGSVPDLSCKVSGEGAKFLGAITDLTGQLKSIFQVVLTPK